MGNAQAKHVENDCGCEKLATTVEVPTLPLGDKVLSSLLCENAEYVRGNTKKRCNERIALRRERLAADGQAPLAAVIACADSRVPPELLFRATLGELFVIRAAGNTTWGAEVQGSIEYAVEHLHVPLVLVLGHTKCGAVGAACAGGEPLPGALGELVTKISKGIEPCLMHDVGAAVCQNVRNGIAALRANSDACVGAAERRGDVVVRGGVYDIASGAVRVLEDTVQDMRVKKDVELGLELDVRIVNAMELEPEDKQPGAMTPVCITADVLA